jgi:hypothetical protein
MYQILLKKRILARLIVFLRYLPIDSYGSFFLSSSSPVGSTPSVCFLFPSLATFVKGFAGAVDVGEQKSPCQRGKSAAPAGTGIDRNPPRATSDL